ncbi:MAG: 1-(5-phosphoribosyl)-5-[(5-phosphoribosylamino)methylideneamino]imidazole-4-carboxamide isomerase [Candidatus Methylomirabilales bacterium]
MVIIPAIDLFGGRVVRLTQGDPGQETVYSDDPVEVARRWEALGAPRLHVVDLDGAFKGIPCQLDVVEQIAKAVKIPIQAGGGLRSLEAVQEAIERGAAFSVLGTSAILDRNFLEEASARYPKQIILAIDAKDGYLAIKGWAEMTSRQAVEVASEVTLLPLAAIIYTDILQDGTLEGPNFDALKALARASRHPLIASGGISSLEDVRNVASVQGVMGMIIGKALYSGAILLQDAITTAVQAVKRVYAG